MEVATRNWFAAEVSQCRFVDERLCGRLRKLLEHMGGAMGESIPLACQDWANTKAAYRFFSNERVTEADILNGHFGSTRDRIAAIDGPVLVLQDTTEFTYTRKRPELIGLPKTINHGRKDRRVSDKKICGVLMHSCLAITTDGLPRGLSAIKFWTRKEFKGTDALKRKVNQTRVPIEIKESYRWLENLRQSVALFEEPGRCVHIGDRESDIYELFCLANSVEAKFLVRACNNRLAGDGKSLVSEELAAENSQGSYVIEVRGQDGELDRRSIDFKYKKFDVYPPVGKQKKSSVLSLTYIHAAERDAPSHRPPLNWQLVTNLPVQSPAETLEKIHWYALRWKIEVFHKILKSGCKLEESNLRTADRLSKLISVCCILSWRLFWMTTINRSIPDSDPSMA